MGSCLYGLGDHGLLSFLASPAVLNHLVLWPCELPSWVLHNWHNLQCREHPGMEIWGDAGMAVPAFFFVLFCFRTAALRLERDLQLFLSITSKNMLLWCYKLE